MFGAGVSLQGGFVRMVVAAHFGQVVAPWAPLSSDPESVVRVQLESHCEVMLVTRQRRCSCSHLGSRRPRTREESGGTLVSHGVATGRVGNETQVFHKIILNS